MYRSDNDCVSTVRHQAFRIRKDERKSLAERARQKGDIVSPRPENGTALRRTENDIIAGGSPGNNLQCRFRPVAHGGLGVREPLLPRGGQFY